MNLTDEMIEEIKSRIAKKLKDELKQKYKVSYFLHANSLRMSISSGSNIEAAMILRQNRDEILEMFKESTGLIWKYNGYYYTLVGGYVVFFEAFDTFHFEQYNEIDGIELHSPILFRDGVNVTCSSLDARCECEVCTWEPNIENFDFAPIMPGEVKP